MYVKGMQLERLRSACEEAKELLHSRLGCAFFADYITTFTHFPQIRTFGAGFADVSNSIGKQMYLMF